MVELKFGGRKCYLRVDEDKVLVCDSTGRPLQVSTSDWAIHRDARDALSWLANRWKISWMLVYPTDNEDNAEDFEPEDRIAYTIPTSGALSYTEELDWLMFHRGQEVYNVLDGKLWELDFRTVHYDERRSSSIRTLSNHTMIQYDEEWVVPRYPDEYFEKFEGELRNKNPGVEVKHSTDSPFFKVTSFVRQGYVKSFPAVEIRFDEEHKTHRVVKLHDMKVYLVGPFYTDQLKNVATLKEVAAKYQKQSWDALFPEGQDVVQLSKEYFYERTFAGHLFSTPRSCGLLSAPNEHTIAWENRYDDMLLLRVNAYQVRCPDEYKGRIFGKMGVNIKSIAQKFGIDHWRLKVV